MPTYEYLCDPDHGGCGHKFDEMQSFKDEPLTDCPECKKKKLRRLFGVPGLIFVGSGFYVNDYGRGSGGSQPAE
jgi:putative FmdB family regulatory protein